MRYQIRCKNCGTWNEWSKGLDESCEQCCELLAQEEIKKKEVKAKLKVKEAIFKILPNDSKLVIFFKHIARAGYVAIMSIVSFVLAILFWLPG